MGPQQHEHILKWKGINNHDRGLKYLVLGNKQRNTLLDSGRNTTPSLYYLGFEANASLIENGVWEQTMICRSDAHTEKMSSS